MRSLLVAPRSWKAAATAVRGHTRILAATCPSTITLKQQRTFAKLTPPGSDPLAVLRDECFQRSLCDEQGFRNPGVHWVFSVAVSADDSNLAPNLRNVGVQRLAGEGIDFVVKNGPKAFADGRTVSFLHSQGKYLPGEHTEQWRGEGFVEEIPLDDILASIPHYTITGMVASKRIAAELSKSRAEERIEVRDKSHLTEIVQQTRIELENGDISDQELMDSIAAYRFKPSRIERMVGGPDTVLWDRWEWKRCDAGWEDPKPLLPH